MLTKIIDEQQIKTIKTLIDGANNIVITAHVSPDGDAMGSSLGMYWYLKARGKNPTIIVPNQYPDFLNWMEGSDTIIVYETNNESAKAVIANADLIFCLDYNEISRLNKLKEPIGESTAPRILVDHHLTPNIESEVAISHPEMCATCELVFRLIDQMGDYDLINHACAEALYTGLMTDTGNFSYNSESPELYIIISQLLKKDVHKDELYKRVYHTYTIDRVKLMGYSLSRKMRIYPEVHSALIVLSKEECERYNFQRGDTEGFVNIPLTIKGIDVSVLVRQEEEKIKISFRSKGEIHVNQMAEHFNGGGHKNAAGGESYYSLGKTVHNIEKVLLDRHKYDFSHSSNDNCSE